MLRNELQQIIVELRNVGSVPLHRVYLATSTPHLLSSCDFSEDCHTVDETVDSESPVAKERESRKYHITHLPLSNQQLDPGQCKNINIWIKAPDIMGPAYIDLLIYYENVDTVNIPK